MGVSADKVEKLRALLTEAPEGVRAFLKPRSEGEKLWFSLEEAILIASK
jgi:hypothetical protein